MTFHKRNSLHTSFFLAGLFLINIVAVTLLICSVCFYFGITVERWQFPAGLLIAALVNYFLYKRSRGRLPARKGLLLVFGLPLGVLLFSILISCYLYDRSYDGQAYHMEAIIQLKQGWNPFFVHLADDVNQAIWVKHYAKGMETTEAAISTTFNLIEAGKAANILLWAGSLLITLSYICRNNWVSFNKGLLISFLMASNPIVINQLISYYVDGAMASMMLCLLVACLFIIGKTTERRYFLLLAILIVLLVNVKFTALLYVGLFIGSFLVWTLFAKHTQAAKRIWWTSVVAGIVSILTGFNPYIVNAIRHQNPFYPLIGEHKVDIIHQLNLPAGFEGVSGPKRFFISMFARTDNIYPKSDNRAEFKIPFTFNATDLRNAGVVDGRLGGFGPMFSGVLILSVILLLLLLYHVRDRLFMRNMLWLTLLVTVSVILMPESWWARYIPQFWLLPVVWVFAAEVLLPGRFSILKKVIYFGFIFNLVLCGDGLLFNLILTSKINYQLAQLKSSGQTIVVDWGDHASNRVRFSEHDIPYQVKNLRGIKVGAGKEYMAGSQTWYMVPKNIDPTIPVPWLMKITGTRIPYMWDYYGR